MNYAKLNSRTEYSTFTLESVTAYLDELEAYQTGNIIPDMTGNYVNLGVIPEQKIPETSTNNAELSNNNIYTSVANSTFANINLDSIPEPNTYSENENEPEIDKIQCIFCRNAGTTDIFYKSKAELQGHLAICVYHPTRAVIASGQLICGLCNTNFGQHKHNYELHVQKCKQIIEKRKESNILKSKRDIEKTEQLVFKYIFELKKLRSSIPSTINRTMVLTILEEITMLFKLLPEGILLAYIKDLFDLK